MMNLKPLVKMMAVVSIANLPATTALYASDLSLYRGNTTGNTSILLMLDTSGSMGISSLVLPKNNAYGSPGDVDSALCAQQEVHESGGNKQGNMLEYQYDATDSRTQVKVNGTLSTNPTRNKTSFYKEVFVNGTTVPYYVRGCGTATVDSNGKLVESNTGKFDRLSRLKDAIITLLADEEGLSGVSIGLGHFSTQTSFKVGSVSSNIQFVDGHSGNILVPNVALTKDAVGRAHRLRLIQAIAQFQSLDTKTKQDGSAADTEKDKHNMTASKQRYSSVNPPQNIKKASSGTPTAHAYAEAAAYMMGTQTRPNSLSTSFINYVYDGATQLRRRTSSNDQNDQAYFICVELGTTPTNALGGTNNVKQCVNNWPYRSGNAVHNNVIDNVYKPDGNGGWIRIKNNSTARAEFVNTMGTVDDNWKLYSKFPSGWRYGGWMKVDNLPMDIEPVAAAAWDQNTDFRNLVTYRTNPFALTESAITASGNPYTDNLSGGISYSASDTKNTAGTKYNVGGSTSSCDGNGIYFLTDGAPNSTKNSMAQAIMNDTLTTTLVTGSPAGTYGFSAKPTGLTSPELKSNLFSGETGGWEYIGAYSQKILDPTKNPASMKIKTAVVGFGSSFAGIPENGDGSYNCDAIKNTNLDAYNACKWGGAEYGNGGFYYAENSDDIKNSIIKFVNDVTVSMTPSSLGSISVPRDPLDQTQVMATGFFPMIMPLDGSTFVTWAGNLKKYKILGGTLKDNSNNAIYKTENNQQIINSSAKDLWSITDGVDHSLVSSGGAWNKIPTPSALNMTGEPSKSDSIRNVFAMDGSTLKRVTKENLATDYSGTTPSALGSANINVTKRYNLLNYLGYKAVATTTLNTTQINALSATTPSSPYRYLGGVVHSTPLVVTDSVTLNSSGNTVSSRKEYVVYGSMEGGLHIVDTSNGEEKSVFVPKEILDNQDGKSLANSEFKETGTLSYGVDAPWTADNTFKVVSSTSDGVTTTKYQATRMNIYGGLRMGGSALYGLNISSPTSPSLLFQITPSTAGFSRMGQIWSKPTIADIRVKGERKRVLIFGGGYDASVYEKDATAFTEPTTATLGNAIYVVDASNGTLLWMASSDTTGIASHKNRASSEMLYSVTGQPVVRDYDADGLADMIYFGDLGGQIFRVDLNNATQVSKTTDVNLGVRVKRLANLRTGSGSSSFVPRFYERLTTAVFGNAANRFVLVTAGSGNRSFPLEGSNQKNKIYGILDYDAATKGIENSGYVASNFKAVATNDNLINRGVLGKTSTNISNWGASGSINDDKAVAAMGPTGTYRGWSFDLRSVGDESAKFYAKSFEESQLISNDLYVNLYDSKAVLGGGTGNACGGGVQGLSTTHRICAPYANCAAYVKQDYQGVLGPILGLTTEGSRTSGLVGSIVATQEACVGQCPSSNTALTDQNLFNYSQSRKIKPTKWYER